MEYNVIVLVLFLRDARDFKRIFFTTFSQVLHRNVRRVRSQNRADTSDYRCFKLLANTTEIVISSCLF